MINEGIGVFVLGGRDDNRLSFSRSVFRFRPTSFSAPSGIASDKSEGSV